MLDPRSLLALPLDAATSLAEAAGLEVAVIPYGPPREGTPAVADRGRWRVAKATCSDGRISLVAVRAG